MSKIKAKKITIKKSKMTLDKLAEKLDKFVDFAVEKFHSLQESDIRLEKKLDSVVNDVSILKDDVSQLKNEMAYVKANQNNFSNDLEIIKEQTKNIPGFAKELDDLRADVKSNYISLDGRITKLEEVK